MGIAKCIVDAAAVWVHQSMVSRQVHGDDISLDRAKDVNTRVDFRYFVRWLTSWTLRYYRRALNLGARRRACLRKIGPTGSENRRELGPVKGRPTTRSIWHTPLMVFQIRAKVNRDPIENGPASCTTYESEQVSFYFILFYWIFYQLLDVRILTRSGWLSKSLRNS